MNSALPPPPKSYRRSHKLLAPALHKLHLSCSHISEINLQSMDRPLTVGEKIRHWLHYTICPVCRKFEKQMRSFTALVKSSFASQEPPEPDPEFLSSLRAKLESIGEGNNPQ